MHCHVPFVFTWILEKLIFYPRTKQKINEKYLFLARVFTFELVNKGLETSEIQLKMDLQGKRTEVLKKKLHASSNQRFTFLKMVRDTEHYVLSTPSMN